MSLGQKIKSLRKENKMTQAELGRLLGVKKAAIQKYENGGIKNLKSHTIERLSEIFNVSPSYLLGFKFDEQYPIEELKDEVKLLEIIQTYVGSSGVELYNLISHMNDDGIIKLLSYAQDIYEKYEKDCKK